MPVGSYYYILGQNLTKKDPTWIETFYILQNVCGLKITFFAHYKMAPFRPAAVLTVLTSPLTLFILFTFFSLLL